MQKMCLKYYFFFFLKLKIMADKKVGKMSEAAKQLFAAHVLATNRRKNNLASNR